jgi:hypothetical protein
VKLDGISVWWRPEEENRWRTTERKWNQMPRILKKQRPVHAFFDMENGV